MNNFLIRYIYISSFHFNSILDIHKTSEMVICGENIGSWEVKAGIVPAADIAWLT